MSASRPGSKQGAMVPIVVEVNQACSSTFSFLAEVRRTASFIIEPFSFFFSGVCGHAQLIRAVWFYPLISVVFVSESVWRQ